MEQTQKFIPTIEFAKKKMIEAWEKTGKIYPHPDNFQIVFNYRLKTCAGRAKKDYWGKEMIEFNPHMPFSEEKFIQTALHEYAHFCVGLGHGHNCKWKSVMISFGQKPDVYHTMASKNIQYYTLYCKYCGKDLRGKFTKIKADNRVKKPYVSSCCRSRLGKKPFYGTQLI